MLSTTPLVGGGVLVEGKDITGRKGRTVLWSGAWDAVQAVRAHAEANEVFDAHVREFFEPIMKAAEAAKAIAHPNSTAEEQYVITEKVEGVEGEVIILDPQGVILRLLDEGKHDRLRWVGDELVAIA
jgi:hypothetical protein